MGSDNQHCMHLTDQGSGFLMGEFGMHITFSAIRHTYPRYNRSSGGTVMRYCRLP